jgi:hypothetical protein
MLNLSDTSEMLNTQQKELLWLRRELKESQENIQNLTTENARLLSERPDSAPPGQVSRRKFVPN